MHFVVDNSMLLASMVFGMIVGYYSKGKMLASSLSQAANWEEVRQVFVFDFMSMATMAVIIVYSGDYMGGILGQYTRLGGCMIIFVGSASFGGLMHHMFKSPIYYKKQVKVE